jgi:hypothetical protein
VFSVASLPVNADLLREVRPRRGYQRRLTSAATTRTFQDSSESGPPGGLRDRGVDIRYWKLNLIGMDKVRKRSTEAYYSTTLFDDGIGHVVVARFKLSGEAEVGVFLVDVFCLGVKDSFYTRMWEQEYDGVFLTKVFGHEGMTPIEPACARKLIEDAVAYADRLGLAPDADYRQACRVLGGIDAGQCSRSFTFGKDGKPFYVQGPNDSTARAQEVIGRLRERCGDGHYDFLMLDGSLGANAFQEWADE